MAGTPSLCRSKLLTKRNNSRLKYQTCPDRTPISLVVWQRAHTQGMSVLVTHCGEDEITEKTKGVYFLLFNLN